MDASSKQLDVTLTGLQPGTVFVLEILDKDHGNIYDAYQALGAPHSPTREQTAYLKQKAWGTKKETLKVADDGTLNVKRELLPWTCMLIKEL